MHAPGNATCLTHDCEVLRAADFRLVLNRGMVQLQVNSFWDAGGGEFGRHETGGGGAMRIVSVALATVWLMVSTAAHAFDCPIVNLDDSKLEASTKVGVAGAISKFLRIDAGADYKQQRNSVLTQFPNADQLVLVMVMFSTRCQAIAEFDWPPERKLEELSKAEDKLFERVLGFRAVASTRERQDSSGLPTGRTVTGSRSQGLLVLVGQAEDLPDLLNEPPFLITDSNKHFVIVGSVDSLEGAIGEMERLKRKAPQYDFEVYAPYEGSAYHSIMMATWVSREVAEMAVDLAKRDVKGDAFIWACRSTGETC